MITLIIYMKFKYNVTKKINKYNVTFFSISALTNRLIFEPNNKCVVFLKGHVKLHNHYNQMIILTVENCEAKECGTDLKHCGYSFR